MMKYDWTEAAIEQLRARRAAGHGYVQIAGDLEISVTAVRDACLKYGAVKRADTPVVNAVVKAAMQAAFSEWALPAGHPTSWAAICAGTCLEGVAFERSDLRW